MYFINTDQSKFFEFFSLKIMSQTLAQILTRSYQMLAVPAKLQEFIAPRTDKKHSIFVKFYV